VPVWKISGRNRFQALQERCIALMPMQDGFDRIVIEPVVVAVIAEGSRALGKIAEVRFVLFVEECILCRKTLGNWFESLGRNETGKSDNDSECQVCAHRVGSVSEERGVDEQFSPTRGGPICSVKYLLRVNRVT